MGGVLGLRVRVYVGRCAGCGTMRKLLVEAAALHTPLLGYQLAVKTLCWRIVELLVLSSLP